jgi:hypothetical protein
VAQTPDQKRQDLLSRLTPGFNTNGRTTKEEFFKERVTKKEQIQHHLTF